MIKTKEFLHIIKELTKNNKARQISRPTEKKIIYYAYGGGRKSRGIRPYKAKHLLDNPQDKVRSSKAFEKYEHDYFAKTSNDLYESNVQRSKNISEVQSARFKSVANECKFVSHDIDNKSFSIVGHAIPKIIQAINEYKSIKVSFHFYINYDRGEEKTRYALVLKTKTINKGDNLQAILRDIKKELMDRIEQQELKGTGHRFESIESLNLAISKYQPFSAGSYIELPEYIANKKCCINIKNDDNLCLMYCVLYHKFKNEIGKNPQRVSKYNTFLNYFDWSGVTFPIKMSKLNKIEELIGFGINVYF